jgi:CPA2 family monovalent cation:H+ antiporter-2
MGLLLLKQHKQNRLNSKTCKDLFGAIFFVSVGMLIDPNTLYEYAIPVMILTFITIFGQSISSTIGALISGQL